MPIRLSRYLQFFLVALYSLAMAAMAEPTHGRKLTLVATEFPPYTATDVSEQGLVSAIARAAFKKAGYDTTLVIKPWARALAEVERGEFDAILAVWYQPQRAEVLAFSDALWTNEIGFYGRRSRSIDVSTLAALKPYTIGVVKDYANPPAFDAANLKTEPSVDDLTGMRKLLAGRVDLVLVDKTLGQYLLGTKLRAEGDKLEWRDPAVASVPLYIALSKKVPGYQERVAAFNQGLAALHRSGEYERIVRRVLPAPSP
jgi:polar amino acid transport system substrate-binding protein